jgi:serine phosphatase RsbU (regulator of sigma subunit)
MRDVIRVLVRDGRPIASVLSTLNDTLLERRGRYCTLAAAAVGEPAADSGQRTVTLYLAGHDRPLLIRTDGQVDQVGIGGTALGLLDDVTCPASSFTLDPGDALAFFTDGVTDRRNGSVFYGTDRLTDAARQLAGYPAAIIATGLRAATMDFSPEQPRDDIALLVLRNESAG